MESAKSDMGDEESANKNTNSPSPSSPKKNKSYDGNSASPDNIKVEKADNQIEMNFKSTSADPKSNIDKNNRSGSSSCPDVEETSNKTLFE